MLPRVPLYRVLTPGHLGGSRWQDTGPAMWKMSKTCDLWEAGVSSAGAAGEQAPMPTVVVSFPLARERQLQTQGLYLPLAV